MKNEENAVMRVSVFIVQRSWVCKSQILNSSRHVIFVTDVISAGGSVTTVSNGGNNGHVPTIQRRRIENGLGKDTSVSNRVDCAGLNHRRIGGYAEINPG